MFAEQPLCLLAQCIDRASCFGCKRYKGIGGARLRVVSHRLRSFPDDRRDRRAMTAAPSRSKVE
jgi:hypothetical protein